MTKAFKVTYKDKMLVAQLDKYRDQVKIFAIGFIIVGIIASTFITLYIEANEKVKNTEKQNILVPKNLGSIYYTGEHIIVRLDANDSKQVFLAQQIEQVCKVNNIPNCMNAIDRLELNKVYQSKAK